MGGHKYGDKIMKILDVIVSFLASALAGTGVGGGGLLVIYLTLARGMGQLAAQGINLSFFISGATAAVPVHIKKRNIDFLAVIFIGAFGIVGAFLGLALAQSISPSLLRKFFGIFLVFCGLKSLRKI